MGGSRRNLPAPPKGHPMTSTDRSRTALLAVCAGLALNGLLLGPIWLFTTTTTFSQTAALPMFAVSQRISWILLTLLVPLVPGLCRPGRRGSTPSWLPSLLQVAFAAQAATAFVMGFVAPWLAEVAPETLDRSGGTFQVATTAIWVAFALVAVVAGVCFWRAGLSRVGALVAVVGALVTPGVGPIGSGILAIGLGLVARSARRVPDEPTGVEQRVAGVAETPVGGL